MYIKKKRIIILLLTICFFIFLSYSLFCFAHSGRTDYAGGHYDRSTGEYHYHHGYPAHQHKDGVCPYETREKVLFSIGVSLIIYFISLPIYISILGRLWDFIFTKFDIDIKLTPLFIGIFFVILAIVLIVKFKVI